MIRKRNNNFHYEFMVGGKKHFGVCTNCTTERQAKEFEKERKAYLKQLLNQETEAQLLENFREKLSGGKAINIEDAFSVYETKPVRRVASEKKQRAKRAYWMDFQLFISANYPEVKTLKQITRQHAEAYLYQLRTHGAFNKKISFTSNGRHFEYISSAEHLSAATINARHVAIGAVFRVLKEEAGLSINPFDLPKLKLDTVSRDAFTVDELKLIGDNMTMPIIKPVFVIGLCTGMTLGDICLLKWEEISGGWITNKIRRKTGTPLEIPIIPPLANFLAEQQSRIEAGEEYVVPELANMYLTNSTAVNYRIKKFLASLDISTSKTTETRSRAVSTKAAHAMRHTFAYLAGVYNIPLPIVQSVLGHMSPKMTELYQKHADRKNKALFFQNMPYLLWAKIEAKAIDNPLNIREELHRIIDTMEINQLENLFKYLTGDAAK